MPSDQVPQPESVAPSRTQRWARHVPGYDLSSGERALRAGLNADAQQSMAALAVRGAARDAKVVLPLLALAGLVLGFLIGDILQDPNRAFPGGVFQPSQFWALFPIACSSPWAWRLSCVLPKAPLRWCVRGLFGCCIAIPWMIPLELFVISKPDALGVLLPRIGTPLVWASYLLYRYQTRARAIDRLSSLCVTLRESPSAMGGAWQRYTAAVTLDQAVEHLRRTLLRIEVNAPELCRARQGALIHAHRREPNAGFAGVHGNLTEVLKELLKQDGSVAGAAQHELLLTSMIRCETARRTLRELPGPGRAELFAFLIVLGAAALLLVPSIRGELRTHAVVQDFSVSENLAERGVDADRAKHVVIDRLNSLLSPLDPAAEPFKRLHELATNHQESDIKASLVLPFGEWKLENLWHRFLHQINTGPTRVSGQLSSHGDDVVVSLYADGRIGTSVSGRFDDLDFLARRAADQLSQHLGPIKRVATTPEDCANLAATMCLQGYCEAAAAVTSSATDLCSKNSKPEESAPFQKIRGFVLFELGEVDAGLGHLRKAMVLDPSDVDTQRIYASSLIQAEQYDLVLTEPALSSYPTANVAGTSAEATLDRATALMAVERIEESREALELLEQEAEPGVSLDWPIRREVLSSLGFIGFVRGDPEKGRARFEEALGWVANPVENRDRKLAQVHLAWAEAAAYAGFVEEAMSEARQAATLDMRLLFAHAKLLEMVNQHAESRERFLDYSRFLDANSGSRPDLRMPTVKALCASRPGVSNSFCVDLAKSGPRGRLQLSFVDKHFATPEAQLESIEAALLQPGLSQLDHANGNLQRAELLWRRGRTFEALKIVEEVSGRGVLAQSAKKRRVEWLTYIGQYAIADRVLAGSDALGDVQKDELSGDLAYLQGEFPRALELARKVLSARPMDHDAQRNYMLSLLAVEGRPSAVAWIDQHIVGRERWATRLKTLAFLRESAEKDNTSVFSPWPAFDERPSPERAAEAEDLALQLENTLPTAASEHLNSGTPLVSIEDWALLTELQTLAGNLAEAEELTAQHAKGKDTRPFRHAIARLAVAQLRATGAVDHLHKAAALIRKDLLEEPDWTVGNYLTLWMLHSVGNEVQEALSCLMGASLADPAGHLGRRAKQRLALQAAQSGSPIGTLTASLCRTGPVDAPAGSPQ